MKPEEILRELHEQLEVALKDSKVPIEKKATAASGFFRAYLTYNDHESAKVADLTPDQIVDDMNRALAEHEFARVDLMRFKETLDERLKNYKTFSDRNSDPV